MSNPASPHERLMAAADVVWGWVGPGCPDLDDPGRTEAFHEGHIETCCGLLLNTTGGMMVVDDLRAAKALIDEPGKWNRYRGRNDDGTQVCSVVALDRACGGDVERYEAAYDILTEAMGDLFIHVFNAEHDHDEVMEAWDRAIALAEEREFAYA